MAVATVLTTAVASVHRASTGFHHVVIAGLRFTYPSINGAGAPLLAIAALGAAALTIAARASWRQRRGYKGFISHIGPLKPLPQDPRVKVIADPHPQAFLAPVFCTPAYTSRNGRLSCSRTVSSKRCWRTSIITGGSEIRFVLVRADPQRGALLRSCPKP